MDKILIIVRHAQAREAERMQKDVERSLTEEGIGDASLIGRYLYNQNVTVDRILSSVAVRAKETAELIAEQLKYDTSRIQYDAEIYDGSVRSLLQMINNFNPAWNKTMIVGHNPSVTYLAEYLTKTAIGSIAPGGYAFLKIGTSWDLASEGTCCLDYYQYPEQVRRIMQI